MYYDSNYDKLNLKEGEEIWGYAFCENFNNDLETKPSLNQPPVLGIIHKKRFGGAVFIPYKKNKHELAESRSIDVRSRRYARTEQDAWDAYSKDIHHALNLHEQRMNFLRHYFNNIPGIPTTLRVITNGICRLVCDISPVRLGDGANDFSIQSHQDIPLYPSCILPNLLADAEWFIESKDSSERITGPDSESIQPACILVEGYDKDNDLYEPLFAASSVEEANAIAASWSALQRKTDMFRSSANEPYDWFCVNDHDVIHVIT